MSHVVQVHGGGETCSLYKPLWDYGVSGPG